MLCATVFIAVVLCKHSNDVATVVWVLIARGRLPHVPIWETEVTAEESIFDLIDAKLLEVFKL